MPKDMQKGPECSCCPYLQRGGALGSTSLSSALSVEEGGKDSKHCHMSFVLRAGSVALRDKVCVGDKMLNIEIYALSIREGVKPSEDKNSKRRV